MSTRRNLILPVYIPTLIMSFGQAMLIPILPLFAKQFVTGYGWIGLILAAEGLGRLSGDIPAGYFVRRLGRNRSMMAGILVTSGSVAGLFLTTDALQIVALRLVAGFGNAVWNVSRHAYLAEMTEPHERGRAISIFGGVNRIGGFAGPAIGGLVAAAFGMRISFLLYAGLALVVGLVSASALSPVADSQDVRTPFRILQIARNHLRVLASAGTGQLCAQAVRAGRNVVIPLYGSDVIGLDIKDVGLILSLASFVDVLMFYPAGVVMDRFGRKFAMVPCFGIQAIGMAAIPLTGSFWSLMGAAVLIGFGNGIGSGTMMALGADFAPRKSMGEFLGLWRLIGDTGHTGSPVIVGGLSDLAGLSPATYAVAALGLVSSLFFATLVPETLKTDPGD